METQKMLVEGKPVPQITTQQVLAELKAVGKLDKAREAERTVKEEETRNLQYHVYYDKIRQVERERDEAIRQVESTRDQAIAKIDEKIRTHSLVVNQAKRILELLRVEEGRPLTIGQDEVNTRDGTVENLGFLIDDEYLKVQLFIVTNRKPTNKYALIAVGRSIFGEPLIKYPYDYGIDLLYVPRRFSLLRVIKEAPTPGALKDWLKKQKDLSVILLAEYERLKHEYKAVKRQYTSETLKELITSVCPQCNNFMTIFDYCGLDTPKCFQHDPYLDMIERR